MNKKNMAVIFGGKTVEHDVSVITGIEFINSVDKNKYNITPIFIDNLGVWYTGGKELFDFKTYKKFDSIKAKLKKVYITPIPGKTSIVNSKKGIFNKNILDNIDVAVIAVHGMNGEDGTIQGLLELANIPYVGSGVLGSAIGMDKIAMKAVFKGNNLPILKYEYFLRAEWNKEKTEIINKLETNLKYPMFVKPANLGSSIGINKAKDKQGLIDAIEIAINYDKRIIVEEGVEDLIEINCSALGYDNDIKTSICEQPVSWQEFLTFEDKYVCGTKTKGSKTKNKENEINSQGMAKMNSQIPANIPEDLSNKIKELAFLAFKHLNCSGVARIDFIINKKDMKPYINEINTIPGSFSFYLWEYSDITYTKLIDILVDIAIKVNKEKNENNYLYNSPIFNNDGKNGSKIKSDIK